MNYTIAALYRFFKVTDKMALRDFLKREFVRLDLCGTLLVADEGINGTLAGQEQCIEAMLTILHLHTGLTRDEVKFSYGQEKPFNRLKVRLKRELITFNQPDADPTKIVGTYVAPQDWNALIDDPEVTVLDTRNVYETVIGTFTRAVDPQIENFTDFASFVRENLSPDKHKKIAMYCTGGIRCEKASSFMLSEGFKEVYHLKGGILKYLEEVPVNQSKWNGECYVFDRRVAVAHGVAVGHYTMCFSCGYPLSAEDKEHKHYEDGVSCEYCYSWSNEADKARFRARHQQITNMSLNTQDKAMCSTPRAI